MAWVGFEPTILVLERVKTVYDLDRAATLVGLQHFRVITVFRYISLNIL
jgi:hypothetical protein